MRRSDSRNVEDIQADELLSSVDALKLDEWRLIQILCIALEDGYELYYSFGGGYAMHSLRLKVKGHDPVSSITPYYPAAFLYENEIRDLFGVRIERIEPDFAGQAYGVSAKAPFAKASMRLSSSERQSALPSAFLNPDGREGEV
jgi:ech hydrogenase subunit D